MLDAGRQNMILDRSKEVYTDASESQLSNRFQEETCALTVHVLLVLVPCSLQVARKSERCVWRAESASVDFPRCFRVVHHPMRSVLIS